MNIRSAEIWTIIGTAFLLTTSLCCGGQDLYDAAARGDVAVVKALLAKGADVNAKDNDGRAPLLVAVGEGFTDVANVLIANGKADKKLVEKPRRLDNPLKKHRAGE
jgi:ankyrin repeat protein